MTTRAQSQAAINEEEGPRVVNSADSPDNHSVTTVGNYPEKVDEKPAVVDENAPEGAPVPEEKKEGEPEKKPEGEVKPEANKSKEPPKVDKKKEDDDRRFAAITKARRIAERERDFLKDRNTKLEEENTKLRQAVPVMGEPQLEDFENDKDYYKALTAWTVATKLKEERDKQFKKDLETEDEQISAELESEMDEAVERGKEKYDDFDEVVINDPKLRISPIMVESALLSDIAEDILYYLGKHPDKASEIAGMPPLKVAREITKIERELQSTLEGKPPAPKDDEKGPPASDTLTPIPNKVPSAPEPITPPRQSGATEKDPAKMTQAEYRAWRERKKQ